MGDSLAIALDRIKFYARDAVVTLTQCICQPDATLKISGRSYKVQKLLGEGGFSFVYLVQDTSSQRLYALKKILITSGNEGVKLAMREVEAYRRFRHPNIIRILDSAVVQDEGGDGKIIYLFLPFYARGNLQDVMTKNSVTGEKLPEGRLLELFHGTCLAVRAMHHYRLPSVPMSSPSQPLAYPPKPSRAPLEGDSADSSMPLMTRGEDEVVFDGDEELGSSDLGELVPYAHRDIKPANIMIADDGSPVLMDFGSTTKARISVENRQQALLEQDIASEHSTMPFRAPELFDVKTGRMLDEKVDIWSLGCTLYAVAYGTSPFETDGGSIAMSVGSGRYRHPPSPYSDSLKALIDAMLVVDPEKRPDIDKVIDLTEAAMRGA